MIDLPLREMRSYPARAPVRQVAGGPTLLDRVLLGVIAAMVIAMVAQFGVAWWRGLV